MERSVLDLLFHVHKMCFCWFLDSYRHCYYNHHLISSVLALTYDIAYAGILLIEYCAVVCRIVRCNGPPISEQSRITHCLSQTTEVNRFYEE